MSDVNSGKSDFSRQKYGFYGSAMKDLILADVGYALAGTDVLGLKPFAFLNSWADGLVNDAQNALTGAAQANSGVAATNTQLSMSGGQQIHAGPDLTGDQSILQANATDNIRVDSTHAAIGFIRCSHQSQKGVITWSGYAQNTVTSLCFDVYSLAADGSCTLLWSSPDQKGFLGTAYTMNQTALPTAIPANYGDVFAIQARMTGSGIVWLTGRVLPAVTSTLVRPYQPGAIRDPSTIPAPPTISQVQMDSYYSNAIPYFQFGAEMSPNAMHRTIADDFQNGLGSWMLNTNDGSTNLTTKNGRLTYTGGGDGSHMGIYQLPLLTDDFDAGFTLSSATFVSANLVLAADVNANSFVSLGVTSSNANLYKVTGGWNGTGSSNYSSVASSGSINANYAWYVTYRSATGAWSVYNAPDASGAPLLTWTEPGSGGPSHGVGHRYFGIILHHTAFFASADADNFFAKDFL